MKIWFAIFTLIAAFFSFFSYNRLRDIQFYDIIIVGSGLAGLTAALEVYDDNLSILLIEKESYLGGNSMKATSGINLLFTHAQNQSGIHDSLEFFISDTMKSSKNLSNLELVKLLAQGSTEAMAFLEKFGVELPLVSLLGGHSIPRTHRPKDKPVGATITMTLSKYIQSKTNIEVRLNTTVIELLVNSNNQIEGLKMFNNNDSTNIKELRAKAIILATGGFAHDFSENSLIKEFAPQLMNYPTTNGPQAEGLGLKMARSIGAELIHMEYVQLHPTGFVDPLDRFSKKKILAPELMRGVGGILLNEAGQRFCNELGTRDYVTEQIKKHGMKVGTQIEAFMVISEEGKLEYGKIFEFYVSKGFLSYYKNWEDFCKKMEIDKNETNLTLEKYEISQLKGEDEFGKTIFPSKFRFDKGIYAGRITPSIHYTMGGLKINEEAGIIKEDGRILEGLYGAGEVTGGVHGGNRLGANSLLECVVFGRIAGKNAVKNIRNKNLNEI